MDLESICFSTFNMPPGKKIQPEEASGWNMQSVNLENTGSVLRNKPKALSSGNQS